MARIRSVKPELRTSEVVASWPLEVRYFFVLLWGYLDDKGRGLDVPKTIAGDCFPHDDMISPAKIGKWLTLMATSKTNDKAAPICRYEAAGRRYLHCVNWKEHQRINRPTASRLPPCPIHEQLTESISEPDGEPVSESLNGSSVPGAGEQGSRGKGSRGAGERTGTRREPVTEPDGPAGTAEQLITTWRTACRKPPPSRVVNDVGRQVVALLRDGVDPDDIAEGLRLWQAKGLDAAILPSVVNQAMNRSPTARADTRPSTTDQRVAAALAAGAAVQADFDRKGIGS